MLQVVPSQGYPVQPGSSYTLRIAVADANHGLVDSVLLLPAGAVRLAPGPMAVTGGPYAVVRKPGWWLVELHIFQSGAEGPGGSLQALQWWQQC